MTPVFLTHEGGFLTNHEFAWAEESKALESGKIA